MDKFAIWSYMEVKPGKEQEVEEFLKYAQSLIEQELGTTTFYALKSLLIRQKLFKRQFWGQRHRAHSSFCMLLLKNLENDRCKKVVIFLWCDQLHPMDRLLHFMLDGDGACQRLE